MNKHSLHSKVKSKETAYLLWFFLGAHYGYLGKWGVQILYWLTLGGLGIWCLIDLFTISNKVDNHNALIFQQIEAIEIQEVKAEYTRNLAVMQAAKQ